MNAYTPEKGVFDGPVTNVLSVLCMLIQVLLTCWCEGGGRWGGGGQNPNHFKFFGTFTGNSQSDDICGKHGSEKVNTSFDILDRFFQFA